jgi:uncharacterized protein YukJ
MAHATRPITLSCCRPIHPVRGMHDIHYNQGDPPGIFRPLDAIWQDDSVIVHHAGGRYEGFFVKFDTQSLNTDDQGLPK